MAVPYPSQWEADVVLRDGGTCHLRPITPADADGLRAFHRRLSPETVYFRFFAPYPTLTDRDLRRFTEVDYDDRVALVATIGNDIIGVVRYDRVERREAEVAFVIRDDFQGRGLGTIFLEHIAQAARERGIGRFVAEVLPENERMLEVFRHAGYTSRSSIEEGVIHLSLEIEPTAESLAVTRAREQRAEALSVERLLRPRSVAVVGASREPRSIGHALLRHLLDAGFTGRVHAVNPEADEVAGVPCVARLVDLAEPVDLVLVAVPAPAVGTVVEDAARIGVHGLVVVSAGFAESGLEGAERQRTLVQQARANGMRVVGPNALGMINTAAEVSLNASLSPIMPGTGRVAFFSQSGALGVALLEAVVKRGLGISTFVSAGNRADISGNDLLQFWETDEATDIVLLYLESVGNPRKFSRITRRLARSKPVVAVKRGRQSQGVPLGHSVRDSALPSRAVEALFEQSGVISTDTVAAMFDVAQLLTFQPLPGGRRVAAVGNSDAMGVMAADALAACGLELVDQPMVLPPDASDEEFERTLAAALDDPAVDALLTLFIPPLHDTGEGVARVLARVAARATKPIVAVLFGVEDASALLLRRNAEGVPTVGSVPAFAAVEDAVRTLGAVVDYAEWRRRPAGTYSDLSEIDTDAARDQVAELMADLTARGDGDASDATNRKADDGQLLDDETAAQLLAHYGISVWSAREVHNATAAARAASELGFPVVLKTVWAHLRMRSDLGGIWFDLETRSGVRQAFRQAKEEFSRLDIDRYLVQRQAPAGVSVVLTTQEDPLFGPVLSFGVSGVAHDLLDDLAFRIPPLTDEDVEELIAEPRAARLLHDPPGIEPVDLGALRDVVARLSRFADDLPEVARAVLRPVVVSPQGVAVLGAHIRLAPPAGRIDLPARRLLG